MEHHFNVEIATKYGIKVAVFLNNMAFWIQKNVANNKHFYDGRHWTFNSVKAYSVLFPYLTQKQIRTTIEYCVKKNLILKGNYNENKHDRTSWYSLSDSMMETLGILICPPGQRSLPKGTTRFAQGGKCIKETDINTDKKQEREKTEKSIIKPKGKPERFSLSDFENKTFELGEKDLQLIKDNKLNFKNIFEKFKLRFLSKGRKYFTEHDLKLWILREIEYKKSKTKVSKKEPKNEIKCTVQEWGPGHPGYDSLNSVKPKIKAIGKIS